MREIIEIPGQVLEDPGLLRPLARWLAGERGIITVYRRFAPDTRRPTAAQAVGREHPRPKALPGGALWYELASDGT